MRFSQTLAALAMLLLAVASSRANEPAKIGDAAGKLRFTDIRSLPRTLDDFGAKKKAFVLVLITRVALWPSVISPCCKLLEREYRDKDVQFVAVNAAEEDSLVAMATQAVKFDIEFPSSRTSTAHARAARHPAHARGRGARWR